MVVGGNLAAEDAADGPGDWYTDFASEAHASDVARRTTVSGHYSYSTEGVSDGDVFVDKEIEVVAVVAAGAIGYEEAIEAGWAEGAVGTGTIAT